MTTDTQDNERKITTVEVIPLELEIDELSIIMMALMYLENRFMLTEVTKSMADKVVKVQNTIIEQFDDHIATNVI